MNRSKSQLFQEKIFARTLGRETSSNVVNKILQRGSCLGTEWMRSLEMVCVYVYGGRRGVNATINSKKYALRAIVTVLNRQS